MPASIQVIDLAIDGSPVAHVDAVEGRESLSQLFTFRILARDPVENGKEMDQVLGKPFSLSIKSETGDAGFRHGIVRGVAITEEGKWTCYDLDMCPEVGALAVGRDSFVFQELTAQDIVSDVLKRAGIPADHVRWSLASTPPTRIYTAQLQESDWEFVERMLADEGLFYFFEHTEDVTTIVFADSIPDCPKLPGSSELKSATANELLLSEGVVTKVTERRSVTSDKVLLRDYNPEKPKTKLEATHTEGEGKYEIYDYPGRFQEASVGTTRAKIEVEALRAKRVTVTGATRTSRMAPGHAFTITGHPVASLNAAYVCIETTWAMSKTGGVEASWTAIPGDSPYREQLLKRDREMAGPQSGVVAGPVGKELHTSDTGDVRVQFYWDRKGKKDEKASTFMRVGQFALGGSMVRPRIGWDMLVEHHQGSSGAPFVLTHLYEGQNMPPYALPANKTRTAWQTATTPGGGSANEIRFEDKKGSEEMFLNASKDMAVTVGDCKDKKVGVDHSHEIGANHDIKVGSNNSLDVITDQGVKIGASETISVSGKRESLVKGAETTTIGAAKTATVSSGCKLDAKAGRTVTVGASMMDVSAMAVSRMVLGSCSATIGAAWISAAAVGLANVTAGASAETVGGAKLQLAGTNVALGVKGALAETVGGAFINLPGGNHGESAQGAMTINVGGAFIGNAPEILIEAENEISITCGGSSLVIKDGSIEIKAPSLASPGATITKDGSNIHHNP